ncbi:MdtA/MuxA family multidrug efflux RND transporter periplasmic adaptor subunit [Phenylobacterium sp.]|uniref:MdtA/MuxA family multidrug efflux RND transporter periplasmic adaptor subunit n=1 Tax=Phenylobacterium sp. TaxID=1871053 RepID=UPI002F3E2CFD
MNDKGAGMRIGRRPGRRILVIGGVLAALAAVAVLAWFLAHRGGAGDSQGPGGRRGRPATTVGVATATQADVPVILDALGTVTPAATVTVRPQVSGVITEILFREGQMVRRGQPLAIIDRRPLQMALMQAEGTLARDAAQLANARLTLTRYKTLQAQDSIARQDVDTQDALARQLAGTVTADRAAVGTARLNLGYSRITAPVSGRVGLRVVDVGNYIGAGDSNGLVVLTQVAPIDVAFTLPQDDVARVQARAAQAVLPVAALDRTRTVSLGHGRFSTLDNRIDPTTGTVRAKARFDNGNGALFPAQFVNVHLQLDTLKAAVVVPVTAVRAGSDGAYVWLLKSDRTVTRRKIVPGPTQADKAVVSQGLKPGERVITEGGDRLTEGGKVQLAGDRPARGGGQGQHGGRRRRGGQAGGGGGAPGGSG